MAINVVYTILEISTTKVHDIIVHEDHYWLGGNLVSGGIRATLEERYPPETYKISVEVFTHNGYNND